MRTGDVIARRYRLEDELGSGAGGVVWSAFDQKLKRTVALKRPHSLHSDAQRAQFRREAESAAQLHHPNAISVFDAVDADGCWLVMEYLQAESLDKILAGHGPLPPERVARIGAQIAAALQAAHVAGIVHRDVKPGNILVTGRDLAKLTDFGISIWREVTVTEDGKISGTAAYVAPEVADGHTATRSSDVFSLGATLFAAVEGEPPFGTGDPDAILARARTGQIPEMRRAGPLAEVLSEMLGLRPGKRPTAEQARKRLMEIAGGWAPPVQPVTRTARSRRPVVWAIGGSVLVAAIAAVLAWPVVRSSPQPAASAVDVIGDPRTADPCGLVDQQALRRFGTGTLDALYGNFNRCDLLIDTGGEKPVDVSFELATPQVPRTVKPGTFDVQPNPPSDDSCDRQVLVSDDYDVWITAKVDNPAVDWCGIADVATTGAVERLRQGPLPRRGFDPHSLANADACRLLDNSALARLPGVDATHPVTDFGNWDCTWNSTLDKTSVRIRFDHFPRMDASDGTPTQLLGHATFVAVNVEDRTCSAKVVHREVADSEGQPVEEVMVVVASGDQPGRQYCAMATDFARAAIPHLP